MPKRLYLRVRLRRVHVSSPACWPSHRPRREVGRLSVGLAARQARPRPLLCPPHEARPQGISLHVATHPQEMPIVAYRNGLEPSLVDCSLPIEAADRLPSSGVRGGEPVHEARQVTVDMGRQQKMPMVRHHAVRKERDATAGHGCGDDALEGRVVSPIFEKRGSFRGSVDDMEEQPSRRYAAPSRHTGPRERNIGTRSSRGGLTVLKK